MFWLEDSERSAFGLGWEYRRRGWLADDQPFEDGSRQARQFLEGWFHCTQVPERLLYHDPSVVES